MTNLEVTVVQKLKTAKYILCTVESCTGGLIAHLVTNVSGASEVFWGSTVAYDNSAKQDLGVSELTLNTYGAVSRETAAELAECGLRKLQNNPFLASSYSLLKPKGLICVATTGIAGPTGGSAAKPVGLCFIGIAISWGKPWVTEFHAKTPATRIEMKTQFSEKALELIREIV